MGTVAKFKGKLPTPKEIGVTIPKSHNKEMFEEGFQHGLVSNKLLEHKHLKASFREGFRAAKLYLREMYKSKNVTVMSMKARIKFTVK